MLFVHQRKSRATLLLLPSRTPYVRSRSSVQRRRAVFVPVEAIQQAIAPCSTHDTARTIDASAVPVGQPLVDVLDAVVEVAGERPLIGESEECELLDPLRRLIATDCRLRFVLERVVVAAPSEPPAVPHGCLTQQPILELAARRGGLWGGGLRLPPDGCRGCPRRCRRRWQRRWHWISRRALRRPRWGRDRALRRSGGPRSRIEAAVVAAPTGSLGRGDGLVVEVGVVRGRDADASFGSAGS